MTSIRRHLTYANVISTLCLFLVIAGGAAYAADTIFSGDIVDDEVFSADVRDDTLAGGGLGAVDLRAGSVSTSEVANGSLRSADVRDDTQADGGLTAAISPRTRSGAARSTARWPARTSWTGR
jgi:hypothetical protein